MLLRHITTFVSVFTATSLFAQEKADAAPADESSGYVWLLAAGIILITALITAIAITFDRKRTAKLQASVQALGGTYRAKATPEEKQLLGSTGWSTASGSRMRNIVELPESEGAQLTLFDFWLPAGKSGSEQTAVRVQSDRLNLPKFDLRPESGAMKIAGAFGAQDIDIASAPNFSRMFRLRGDDEAAVRQLFTPAIIQFCETHARLRMAGSGDSLLYFREHERAKPDNLAPFIAQSREIAALFATAPHAPSSGGASA